ncbi:sulfatase [Halorhabdus sp. BNX81]|uniref:sulfatase n=1 Tax=Halorhabdus sp. BNX81 TaxID=2980181 RepID=UPI0023DD65D3|nr:sulfatase [Halorhabdus sp. BNX81]
MTGSSNNVILISCDALRADHLGCYGYRRNTTPELDEFAQGSVRFRNAYSVSSHTREAVPALMTGQYPDVAIDSKYHLVSNTIASRLSEHGYATAGFHSNPYLSRSYNFDRGFDTFDDDLYLGQHKIIALAQRALDKLRNRHYARAEEINRRALAWLDSIDTGEPFFLWNHYLDTHGPYNPPAEYATLYADREISGREAQRLYKRAINDPESITDDEQRLLIDLYDGEIKYNDEYIGRFLASLRERELLEDAIVLITADHGEAFGEHGCYGHPRYLHDELTHVPMIVQPPGNKASVLEAPTSTLDIAATILDMIGRDADLPGESALADRDGDRPVFLQVQGEDNHSHLKRYAVRTHQETCRCERDCGSNAVEYADCADQGLRSELETHVQERIRRETGDGKRPSENVDGNIERRLEALGYK